MYVLHVSSTYDNQGADQERVHCYIHGRHLPPKGHIAPPAKRVKKESHFFSKKILYSQVARRSGPKKCFQKILKIYPFF
jgi:hypothetical protein